MVEEIGIRDNLKYWLFIFFSPGLSFIEDGRLYW